MNSRIRFFANLKRLQLFLRDLGLEPAHLFVPSLLAFLAALFEGATFTLLAPTMRGLMESNFQFTYSIKWLGPILKAFPALFQGRSSGIFIFLIVLILGAAVLKNVLSYFSGFLVAKQVRRFSHELRCRTFDAYIGFQKSFFDKNSVGHLQNVLIGFTERIAEQFKIFQGALFNFFSLLAYLAVMLVMSWKVTLFILFSFPVLMLLFDGVIKKIRTDSEKYSTAFTLLGKKISNALSCMPLVKASCAEDREKRWFNHVSEEVRSAQVGMDKRNLLIGPAQEVFFLVLTLLLVGFMAYLTVRQKEGNLSSYLIFFVVIRRAMASIGSLVTVQGAIAGTMGPLREVVRAFEERDLCLERTGVLPFLEFKEKIEFSNLTFRYQDRDILKNLHFEIKKGQMVAIVGATGAGKSTIAQLLLRFYDAAPGMLLVDGQDILHFQTAALRKKIAYISQDNYFFDTSIDINLKYGCAAEPSKEEVESVIEKAQLKEFIARLPQGIQTEIGERGIQLSGGEKQRLSLARAILRDPEILILDEATSAMDSQTEKLVQASIVEAAKGRTCIVIAHRLATVQKADLILVIERGRLVERGSFSELMTVGGRFKMFWDSQGVEKRD